ncbi:MAG: hypothetical protein C0601_00295 [Candidatus Muiribacterium halophilum]|uniref:Glycosyltransferase subfamily 4-like N-terminal domain-containing protein n=1 Tax=Muiribacterium halophilum TaxID=2053465 RepID=A0A2N5ZN38_MUIH1|nr:MAG: hypothetical protein C0601_00295 [Candidatus Muirbacterium halophilum]
MIRLLYVLNDLKIGGAETQVVKLLNRLSEKGYVITLALLWKRGKLLERLDDRIRVIDLGMDKGKLNCYRRLNKLFNRFKPDVVNARLFYASLITKLALRRKNIPIIMTHGSLDRWRNDLINTVDSFLSKEVDLFIANSPAVALMLNKKLNIKKEKIIIIPNGIEGSDFPENEFNGGVFGFLGRDSQAKGLDRFVEFIKKEDIKYKMYVAGEEIIPKGVERSNIVFNSNDINRFFKDIDILVVPSRWEGMPNVILEAGVFGKTVFASSGLGIEEIFENNIEYFSDIDGLQTLANKYKDNPFLVMKKGQDLWEKVNNDFSIEKMVEKYDRIYREAVSKSYDFSDK